MVKRLRSVPAPQTMVANAVPAPVFGPISQVHVTLPTAFARGTQLLADQRRDQRSDKLFIRDDPRELNCNDDFAFDNRPLGMHVSRLERSPQVSQSTGSGFKSRPAHQDASRYPIVLADSNGRITD